MADLVILGGVYLFVQALIRLSDWYTGDWLRLAWSASVYLLVSLFLIWWYAPLFTTIITPGVAVFVLLLLAMTVWGAYYAARLRPPWQLRENLYLAIYVNEVRQPAWQTVATQAFALLWQNVFLVAGLLLLLEKDWSIWFVLGAFLMVIALVGIIARVWRDVAWYAPWIIFTFTLPVLLYVVLFFPGGFGWLLLLQILAYVALHAEVEVHRVDIDDD